MEKLEDQKINIYGNKTNNLMKSDIKEMENSYLLEVEPVSYTHLTLPTILRV